MNMDKTKDNEKRGFIVYATLEDQLAFLSDEQVGKLFRAMFVHFRGEEPVLEDTVVRVTYAGVRSIMDLDREKWERTREARREAGRRGGMSKAERKRGREESAEREEDDPAGEAAPAPEETGRSPEERFREISRRAEETMARVRSCRPAGF